MFRPMVVLAAFATLAAAQTMRDALADARDGRYADAERKLAVILVSKPDSAEAVYLLGMLKLEQRQVNEARPLLERATRLAPESASAWKALGVTYAAQGDLEGAIAPFRKACDLNPVEAEACYYLARNYYALNRFEPALEPLTKVLRSEQPGTIWRAHRALAQNYEALGRSAEAEREFRKAIAKHGNQGGPAEDPRIDFGIFLLRQGRVEESISPLEDAVKAMPDSPRARHELGRSLLQLSKLEDAAAQLRRAVELDPKMWSARLLLGRVYLRMGRTKEGEREVEIGEKGLAAEGYGSSAER